MTTIINGNKINEEIKDELRSRAAGLSLAVIWVGDNPASAKYIEKKKRFGEDIGVRVDVFKYGTDTTTVELAEELGSILRQDYTGVIVQLPLPPQIDTPKTLNMLPRNKDVDLLSDEAYRDFIDGKSDILPPVVGSIKEIFERNGLQDIHGLKAVVVGKGKLVGRPVAAWLVNRGAEVTVIGRNDWADSSAATLAKADIIISGAGVPGLITADMVRGGAVIIDAATSDVSGVLKGDVDMGVADKCHIFSPVPGGVGPITVAMLFKNLTVLGE